MRALMLLWVAVALARRPKVERPDPQEIAAAEAKACAKDTPENFQIHTGYATHGEPAKAKTMAVAQARQAAIRSLCAGKSEARCQALTRHIESWKTPFYNPLTQAACAHVGVQRRWIDDDRGDQAQLQRDLRALGGRVAERVDQQVLLSPPLWASSGCSAGEVGAAISSELRNALAKRGDVLLVEEGQRADHVQILLDTTGAQVALQASLRKPHSPGAQPIEGFSFPVDLFELNNERGSCRFDHDLGLVDGARDGAGGLRVWVTTGGQNLFCEGELTTPLVHVNRPAIVKVFSVDQEGTALLVWPPPGERGLVESDLSLGEMMMYPSPGLADEKLMAVAMPPGGSWGQAEGWTGFCQFPGVFSGGSYPKEAAAGAASLLVLPRGSDRCAGRQAPPPPPSIPELPTCPSVWGGG